MIPMTVRSRNTSTAGEPTGGGRRVCPWWIGCMMLSPLRRLFENPERMLRPLVRPGMTVVDFGSAMGFFSLPLARMVGEAGTVLCVDIQPRMLAGLERRAARAGVGGRIKAHVCAPTSLGLDDWAGDCDLVVAIHAVHEVPDVPGTMGELWKLLRPKGEFLLVEPRGHVSAGAFRDECAQALSAGFVLREERQYPRSRGVVLEKPL